MPTTIEVPLGETSMQPEERSATVRGVPPAIGIMDTFGPLNNTF
jgi:hypothetical protein